MYPRLDFKSKSFSTGSPGALKTYIFTIVSRYKGQVAIWDVLNETVSWKPLWANLVGEDYAELALVWAHEADPDAYLFYNDYDIEGINKKSDAVFHYIKSLVDKGVPFMELASKCTYGWLVVPAQS